MSLGDYLRLLRARHGGVTPWEIEATTNLPKGLYRQIEQRYRAVGDDESVSVLADYYSVPVEDLRWRLEWPRKALSRALVACMQNASPITLGLWDGTSVSGHVMWWDLGATALQTEAGEVVVQRHAVERWDPRAADEDSASTDEQEG